MIKYLYLLKDSFHETMDKKSFFVLLIAFMILPALTFTIRYEDWDDPDAMADSLLEGFTVGRGASTRPVWGLGAADAQWLDPHEPSRGLRFTMTTPATVTSPALDEAAICANLAREGFGRSEASLGDGAPPRYQVVARSVRTAEAPTVKRIHILFGAVKLPPEVTAALGRSRAHFTIVMQSLIANFFVGWVGILVAVVVTAGMIPSALRKGTVEVLLSKPMNRVGLLLTKYVGGQIYVLFLSTLVLGSTWAGLGMTSGLWNPGFLVTIPLLVFFFAVLYAVSTLFGVISRGAVMPIGVTLVTWFLGFLVHTARGVVEMFRKGGAELPGWFPTLVDVLYWVLPKPSAIKEVSTLMIVRGPISEEVRQALLADVPTIEWQGILASSAGFTALTLACACWVLSRREH